MLRRFVSAVVALATLFAIPAYALPDVPGSRDHPLFRRPPGYKIVSYALGNRSVTIPFQGEIVAVSGKQTDILYRTEGRPFSPAALDDRFMEALRKAGGEIVSKENPFLGGRRVVGRLTRPGRTVWVMQDVHSLREYRLVVMETPNNRTPLSPVSVSNDIYEMEAEVLDLLHRVERTGVLEFPLRFAPGATVPLKGYETNFRKIVMLMDKDPSLCFRVETWADPGTKPMETRMQLRSRSAALLAELVRMGADAPRLTTVSANGEDAAVPTGIVRLVAIGASDIPKQ